MKARRAKTRQRRCLVYDRKYRSTESRWIHALPKRDQDKAEQAALRGLDTLRGAKKHFDMALGQYFQLEKIDLCPQSCPQLR